MLFIAGIVIVGIFTSTFIVHDKSLTSLLWFCLSSDYIDASDSALTLRTMPAQHHLGLRDKILCSSQSIAVLTERSGRCVRLSSQADAGSGREVTHLPPWVCLHSARADLLGWRAEHEWKSLTLTRYHVHEIHCSSCFCLSALSAISGFPCYHWYN